MYHQNMLFKYLDGQILFQTLLVFIITSYDLYFQIPMVTKEEIADTNQVTEETPETTKTEDLSDPE